MLNDLLVKQGLAEPKLYTPDTIYAEVFEYIETESKNDI